MGPGRTHVETAKRLKCTIDSEYRRTLHNSIFTHIIVRNLPRARAYLIQPVSLCMCVFFCMCVLCMQHSVRFAISKYKIRTAHREYAQFCVHIRWDGIQIFPILYYIFYFLCVEGTSRRVLFNMSEFRVCLCIFVLHRRVQQSVGIMHGKNVN